MQPDKAIRPRRRSEARETRDLLWVGALLVCVSVVVTVIGFLVAPLITVAVMLASVVGFVLLGRGHASRRAERRSGEDRRSDARPQGPDRRSGLDRRFVPGADF